VAGPVVDVPLADATPPRVDDEAPKIRPFSKPDDAAAG
jgi:hypothetical protein